MELINKLNGLELNAKDREIAIIVINSLIESPRMLKDVTEYLTKKSIKGKKYYQHEAIPIFRILLKSKIVNPVPNLAEEYLDITDTKFQLADKYFYEIYPDKEIMLPYLTEQFPRYRFNRVSLVMN